MLQFATAVGFCIQSSHRNIICVSFVSWAKVMEWYRIPRQSLNFHSNNEQVIQKILIEDLSKSRSIPILRNCTKRNG